MKRWLSILALLFGVEARANDCGIQFALPEQLGPPGETSQTVSVIPYDASPVGGQLAVCWATEANKNALATYFNNTAAPPTGVTCAVDAAWNAAERVDLVMTPLVENTHYHYKILCDQPDPGNPAGIFGHRGILDFYTVPNAGDDDDFMFTAEFDPHYGTGYHNLSGLGGDKNSVTSSPILLESVANNEFAIGKMAAARGIFHANLGDYYQVDANQSDALRSHLYTPRRRADSGILSLQTSWNVGDYLNPVPGYPTRNAAACSNPNSIGACLDWENSIQIASTDANVLARAKWSLWKIQSLYNAIYNHSPLVLAWGNHDQPWMPACSDSGTCLNWCDDTAGVGGTSAWSHMANAWQTINVNPAGASYYAPTAGECETVAASGVPACNLHGQYYRFAAGLAEFWVINPFEATGGHGTAASTQFDGTRQFPETAADWSLGEAQWNWLNETVAASTAKYKFLLTHHAVGGQDPTQDQDGVGGPASPLCQWYARGALFGTAGRFCDVNGNTVDDGAGEKDCSIDDSLTDGFIESEDPRPAIWTALNGACAAGVLCAPTPYNNRTAAMAGDATFGQEPVQALLKANLNSGGINLILIGHDHLTAGGCKEDTDGCSDVWYITGGQPTGDGDGATSPPFDASNIIGGRWDQMWDFNGDTIADYRTDGAPYPTPVDREALTLRKPGSQIRGFAKVYVSSEGVKLDWIATDIGEFLGNQGETILSYRLGQQATTEDDFDGATTADKETKRAAEAMVATGDVACNDTTSPAPLEGTQSCRFTITTNATSLVRDGWADTTALTCFDHMLNMVSDVDSTTDFAFSGFRNDTLITTTAALIGLTSETNCAIGGSTGNGEYCVYPRTRSASGTTGTPSSPMMQWGTTYQVRFCFTGAVDDAEVWVDACDPDDDNCDGKLDGAGTAVTPPTWGAGTFYHNLANGTDVTGCAGAPCETDGYRFGSNINADGTWLVDAAGVCVGWNPGEFKCGDGFE